jgi:hypothetical protein
MSDITLNSVQKSILQTLADIGGGAAYVYLYQINKAEGGPESTNAWFYNASFINEGYNQGGMNNGAAFARACSYRKS